MEKLIFSGYPDTNRGDIVSFTLLYGRMIAELKTRLIPGGSIKLSMGRISDAGFEIGNSVNYSSLKRVNENTFEAKFLGNYYNNENEPQYETKIIRMDNPFGEIPVLEEYKQLPKFLIFGEELQEYRDFIFMIRTILTECIGKEIQFVYKNDDGSFSVIEGVLCEVNKGNFLMEDQREYLIRYNKTVTVNVGMKRVKNHRFISGNGYLISAGPAMFDNTSPHDDDEVFGEKEVWNFKIPEKTTV